MSVNVKALTTAGAAVAAVSYVICALLVAAAPESMATLGSYIVHIDIEKVGRSVTLFGGIIGGVSFTVIIALFFGATGWLYNYLSESERAKGTVKANRNLSILAS